MSVYVTWFPNFTVECAFGIGFPRVQYSTKSVISGTG